MFRSKIRVLCSLFLIFALCLTSTRVVSATEVDSEEDAQEETQEEISYDAQTPENAPSQTEDPADEDADAQEPEELTDEGEEAQEPGDDPEDASEINTLKIDISEDVLQAGGFLPEEEAESGISTYAASEDFPYYEEVKELLIEGYTNFAEQIVIPADYRVTTEQVSVAATDVFNENYQFFYLGSNFSCGINENGYVVRVYPTYVMERSEAEVDLAQLEAAIDQIVSDADASFSDMEKALYINDFLARDCEYKLTGYNAYNAYGALVERKAVCQGYAIAYRALAAKMDLGCELVTSMKLNHAWNIIKVGSSYYHVDTTWNDPLTDCLGRARHQYLMKSTSYFQSSSGGHKADDWVLGGELTQSDASDTSYDSYFWDDSDAGLEYINGTWYVLIDGKIYAYSCNGSTFTKKSTIKTITDKWYRWGSSTTYRTGNYSYLASGKGALYYSLPGSIRRYQPSDGSDVTVYELSSDYAAKGYIYGLRISAGGEVEIHLATAPYSGSIGNYTVMNLDSQVKKYLSDATLTLTTTSYTYNGSAKKPGVTVKYGSTKLTKDTDYTVSYSNNTNAGTATVTVKGKGNYTGTLKKNFTISKASGSVTAKAKSTEIVQGKTTTITASGKGTLSYSSSNKSIATVNSKGTVTAKAPGKVTITVKAAGNSNYKSATKTVTLTVNPKATSISSVKNGKSKNATVKWKKVSGVTGYQIQYSTSNSFKSKTSTTVKGASKVSKTISKLKKGKTYYFRIRAYKTVSGTKYYSAWSGKKSVKIKK